MSDCSRYKWLTSWFIVYLVLCTDWVSLCVSCSYLPQDSSLQSETVHFKRGVGQQFCLPSHTVNLSEWADEEVSSSRLSAECWNTREYMRLSSVLWNQIIHKDRWKSTFSPQLLFDMDKEVFPMVVQAVVDEGEGELLITLMDWCESRAAGL